MKTLEKDLHENIYVKESNTKLSTSLGHTKNKSRSKTNSKKLETNRKTENKEGLLIQPVQLERVKKYKDYIFYSIGL